MPAKKKKINEDNIESKGDFIDHLSSHISYIKKTSKKFDGILLIKVPEKFSSDLVFLYEKINSFFDDTELKILLVPEGVDASLVELKDTSKESSKQTSSKPIEKNVKKTVKKESHPVMNLGVD